MARAREPRFLGSARRPRMHTHRERAQARMCTHVCERGRARSVCRAARTHRPDDGAIPILGAHGCAQTERSPRRERPLPAPALAHTAHKAATEGVGEERRIGGRAAFTARAHRGRRARAPLSRRSRCGPLEPGGRRPGVPRREVRHTAACSPTSLLRWVERRQRQRREPRGECGVHNTRACVHIRHGESGCGPYRRKRSQPTPDARVRNDSDSATEPP